MTRGGALVLLSLVLLGCARGGSTVAHEPPQFRLDWQTVPDARGAIVRGQLHNGHSLPARDIHLLVEGLDASGKVVTRTNSALRRIVLSGERAPFDIVVPGAADRYRVTVVSFDLVLSRGGR